MLCVRLCFVYRFSIHTHTHSFCSTFFHLSPSRFHKDSDRNYASSMTYMCVCFATALCTVHCIANNVKYEIAHCTSHIAHWSNDAKVLHTSMPAISLTELNIFAIYLYNIPMSYIGWNEFKWIQKKKMINHAIPSINQSIISVLCKNTREETDSLKQ